MSDRKREGEGWSGVGRYMEGCLEKNGTVDLAIGMDPWMIFFSYIPYTYLTKRADDGDENDDDLTIR